VLFALEEGPRLQVIRLHDSQIMLELKLPCSVPLDEYAGSIIIHPDSSAASPISLFTQEHQDRLFAISSDNADDEEHPDVSVLFKRSDLLRLIEVEQNRVVEGSDSDTPPVIDVTKWSDAKVFELLTLSQVWVCAVHGLKVIMHENFNRFCIIEFPQEQNGEFTRIEYTWPLSEKVTSDPVGQEVYGAMLLADGVVIVTVSTLCVMHQIVLFTQLYREMNSEKRSISISSPCSM
jgi:hypothetical protein